MVDFVAWHGETRPDHVAKTLKYVAEGYRFVSLSIYGDVFAPVYAAVMVKQNPPPEQRNFPLMTVAQWQQTFDKQAFDGFGPVILAATGSASNPRFAAVFQPQSPIVITRHGLVSNPEGTLTDATSIQGMDYFARTNGMILRWAASYGSGNDPRFAAIWVPNSGATLWNNDGLTDSASNYQARFNAETAAWCRPSFVTLDADNAYLSLFVADEIGDWVARHNMTPAGYQTEFDTWTKKGYFPSCVQAAGANAACARLAAIFVKGTQPIKKRFTATGPVANADIDAVMEKTMATYPPVRHAALAIVHGTRLIYARGYALAEPDWPVVHPTTFFRLASGSKTVTALAVFQLIESGQLTLSDPVQKFLQLHTPSGGQPIDPDFGSITVQQLLEHTSGLQHDEFADATAVVNAFHSAGLPASLPVDQTMTDNYIATLKLDSPPGQTQVYSNCGYYLLGRLAAKLRGTAAPIDAYRKHLMAPLGITRIRNAVDLLKAQPADEARYQAASFVDPDWTSDLAVAKSINSNDQPLVATGYGDYPLAVTQGCGGLSAAAPDLARLVAVLIDPKDTAALKRRTLNEMLTNAANVREAGQRRAGYGLDDARNQGNDRFYGQKGGLIANAASVFQFDGDSGFVALWGSTAYRGNRVYPDFHGVMDTARELNWGSTDLFPEFGMRSL